MKRIGILGGGISGLVLAYYLREEKGFEVTILEKQSRWGGLCQTFVKGGFKYDIGGHIMFSKDEKTLNEMVGLLGKNVAKRKRNAKIYYKGRQIKYPFENDLAALEKADTFECLMGFIDNPWSKKQPKDFREWIYHTFGRGIAEKFMIPYNQKIWKTEPEELNLEWVGRIPKPPVEDVVKSAIGIVTEGLKHQLYYYYPKRGGYESLVTAVVKKLKDDGRVQMRLGVEVTSLEKLEKSWRVMGSSGESFEFDEVVTTVPPQLLMKIVKPVAPAKVQKAVADLRYNRLVMVMLGYKRPVMRGVLSFNIPGPECLSHRICFPKSFSPDMGPAGQGVVAAEITVAPGSSLERKPDSYFATEIINWLDKEGIAQKKELVVSEVRRVEHAYVVYDKAYSTNREKYLDYLKEIGLIGLGRFGRFIYINSDVCFAEARDLAKQMITKNK